MRTLYGKFDTLISAVGMDPLPLFLATKVLQAKEVWLAVPSDGNFSADCFVNAVGREAVPVRWGAWDGGTSDFANFVDYVVGENITGEKIAIIASTGTRIATVALSRLAEKLSRDNEVSLVYVNMSEKILTLEPLNQGCGSYPVDIDVDISIDELAKLVGTKIDTADLSTERGVARAQKRFPLALEVNQRKGEFVTPLAIAPYGKGMGAKRVAAITVTRTGRVIVIDDGADPPKSLEVARQLNGASGAAVIVSTDKAVRRLNRIGGFLVVDTLDEAMDAIADFSDGIGVVKNRYANPKTVYPEIFNIYGEWIE